MRCKFGFSVMAGIGGLLWQNAAYAQPMFDREWGWHPAWGFGHMMVGGLIMIVFWIVLVVLSVLIVRWLWGASPPHGPTPLDELKRRFARGEIDEKEYRERRKILSE